MRRLSRLLTPRSIAVIGGGAWGASVIEQCRKVGYQGALYAVHPKRAEVAGVATVTSVAELPEPPDAVFVGVNRAATIEVVRQLRDIGAGGAVCFASGFSEAEAETGDGVGLQAALLQAAGDMPILGPNCYGFLNYLDGAALWPDQHGGKRVARGVAILTQSSNIAINLTMQRRGLPLAYVVTLGNQAQTDLAEVARDLLTDPRVTALGLHIEGIGDLRGLEALAAEAHAAGKPIVALKVGASEQAQAATVSHTASLAGSAVGSAALLKRLGIGQVHSLTGLVEALKVLHVAGPLDHAGIASMSCSGGEASLMADLGAAAGVAFPPLSEGQEQGLRAALGPSVALANPLDYHTYIWGDEVAMQRCFSAMMTSDLALGTVVLDLPRGDTCDAAAWDPVLRAVAATRRDTGRPMAVLASLPEGLPEDLSEHLIVEGVIPLCGMSASLEGIRAAASVGKPFGVPLLLPEGGEGKVLSEAEAKTALGAFGLRVPRFARATSAEEAAKRAAEIGFPVVLKAEGLAHKSDYGGVALNLCSTEAVAEAAGQMTTAAGAESFLIEELLHDKLAELLIGVTLDPAHGYVLTLAAGGVLTEVLQDAQHLLLPTDRAAVLGALSGLKMHRLLTGYRGALPANLDAICNAVLAVEAYVMAHRPTELDINPLICGAQDAVAADALIKTGGRDDRRDS